MFLTALLAVTMSAPVPKAKTSELYYPTAEGSKRVLELSQDGKYELELTETVTKVESTDGIHRVTVEEDSGRRRLESVLVVTADGVFEVVDGMDDPEPLLKVRLKAGASWELDRKLSTTTRTVGEEEEVEVPAGKFTAIPVTTRVSIGDKVVLRKETQWFARGVGVVKMESESHGRTKGIVLKSFTPGKDAKK